MNAVVEKALELWGMTGATYSLITARENAVFKVGKGHNTVAMRLHRKGYRSDQELLSELNWMAAVARGHIPVPAPVNSASGEILHTIDGVQVDVLSWMNGSSVENALKDRDQTGRSALFHAIGRQMARLHEVSDAWTPPEDFVRCSWDAAGLVGEAPLWDRFWDNPALSDEERNLLLDVREKARSELASIGCRLDYGLIHADLVSLNIMVDGDEIQFIDFDDGGYGFRSFEIATALLKYLDKPDFMLLRAALIEGYRSVRLIDLSSLDLFLVLRAATYVGWNMTRMTEDGAGNRNVRFIEKTCRLAKSYLASGTTLAKS